MKFSWNTWFRQISRKSHRKAGWTPRVEVLEDRLAPAIINVTTTADVAIAGAGGVGADNQWSLREAITFANGNNQNDTIKLKTNRTYNIELVAANENANVGGDFDCTDTGHSIAFIGGNQNTTIISANGQAERVFHAVNANVDLLFKNLTIRDGDSDAGLDGGGVYAEAVGSDLSFSLVSLFNNHSGDDGGGFYVEGGAATVGRSTISGNTAESDGGGFCIGDGGTGDVKITDTTISNNNASQGAGFFVTQAGDVTVTRCIIAENDATNDGGGIMCEGNDGLITILDSDIRLNTAVDDGGGVRVEGANASLTISRSQVRANTANSGAGVLFAGDDLIIHRSTIDHNHASDDGGGLWLRADAGDDVNVPTANITNSTFGHNTADDEGGAVWIDSDGADVDNMVFDSCTIAYNFAGNAGSAIYNSDEDPNVSFRNSIIAKNEFAPGQFGGNAVASNGYNLLSFDDSVNNAFNAVGDLKGTEAAPLNPGLGALGYWYGSTTKVFPLLSTIVNANGQTVRNKAINNGNTALPNDQIGQLRTGLDDIGAVEKPGQ